MHFEFSTNTFYDPITKILSIGSYFLLISMSVRWVKFVSSIVSGCEDKTLHVKSFTTGSSIHMLEGHTGRVRGLHLKKSVSNIIYDMK